MMMTHQQLSAYRFIVERIGTAGRSPTYIQIAAHLGLRGSGEAHHLVGRICSRGYLRQCRKGITLPRYDAFILDYQEPLPNGWPSLVRVIEGTG